MAIEPPTKCPHCGSTNFDFITPPTGTSYVLTTVDATKNPPVFNPTSGLGVQVMGCDSCGILTFHVPSLERK